MGHKMALSVVNVLISQTAHFVCLSGLMRPQVPWARAQKSMQYYPNSTLIRTGHMLRVWSMQIYAETNLINASRVPAQTNDKHPWESQQLPHSTSFFPSTYPSSLDTSALWRNPRSIAAMATPDQALPSPTDASYPRDDESPRPSHCDRSLP